jgi:putative inorganic carbon (HCO3(-)) transporter
MSEIDRVRLGALAQRAAWWAFVAVVVLSPFRARIDLVARPATPVYGDYTNFLLFLSDIAVVVTLGLWLLSVGLHRRPVTVGPRFLAWPVAVLLVVAWLGVPFSSDVALAAYNATRLVVLAVLGLYVVNEVGRVDRVVLPAALMVIVQAVVGIGQAVGQRSLGLSALGEHVLSPSLGVSVITARDGTRILRAYGLTDHPNILGGLLAFALVIIAGGIAIGSERGRAWRLPVFAIGAVALLLTFSRGAWLGLLAGLAVLVAMLVVMHARPALRRVGAACVAGVIVVTPFVAPYRSALGARTATSGRTATEVRSVDEREALADATTDLLVKRPVLGVGIGTLPLAMRTARPAFQFQYQPASIVLLDVTAETGLIGGISYLVLLVAPWIVLARERRRWTLELAVASGALAAVSVVGLFDYYPWSYSAGRIWAWLILGLWAAAYRTARSTTEVANAV